MQFFRGGILYIWEQQSEGTCPVVKITRKYESRKQLTWFRCESSIHSTFWRQGVFAEKWCPYIFSWQKLYTNCLQTHEPIQSLKTIVGKPLLHIRFTFAHANQRNEPRSGDVWSRWTKSSNAFCHWLPFSRAVMTWKHWKLVWGRVVVVGSLSQWTLKKKFELYFPY